MRSDAPSRKLSPTPGPIQILCEEIGYPFDREYERVDVLVAFFAELVDEVEGQCALAERLSGPSANRTEALSRTRAMLQAQGVDALRSAAAHVHEVRLEEPWSVVQRPVESLRSCASPIRFGLETPCHSRHAAHAAQSVFRNAYGLTRYDAKAAQWEREWTRDRFAGALRRLNIEPIKARLGLWAKVREAIRQALGEP